jgi:hypothetical protein
MRFLAAMIAFLAMLAPIAAAETSEQSLVGLLKSVCVSPETPEASLQAAEKSAGASDWKLVKSGPMPFPIMHNDNGPPVSVFSAWEFDVLPIEGVILMVSIAGPELPGVRHTLCGFTIPDRDFFPEKAAFEIAKQFPGSVALVRKPGEHTEYTWYFAQSMSAGNCGKSIALSHEKYGSKPPSYSLIYMDMNYPQDGKWDPLIASTKCRFPTSK